jgi:hypothetical protein
MEGKTPDRSRRGRAGGLTDYKRLTWHASDISDSRKKQISKPDIDDRLAAGKRFP